MNTEPTSAADGEDDRSALQSLTQAAFDGAPVGMALTELDDEGGFVISFANDELARMLGHARSELAGMTLGALTHPDDRAADTIASTTRRDGAVDVRRARMRFRHADGHDIWAELHARTLPERSGPAMTLAHIVDIDDTVGLEQAQAEQAAQLEADIARRTSELAASEQRLRGALQREIERRTRLDLIMDATATSIGEWDLRNETMQLSPNWYQLHGYDPDDATVVGLRWSDLVHPDDWPQVARLSQEWVEAKRPSFDHTYRVRRGDGSWQWNRHRGAVTEWDEAGRPVHIVGIDTDVTEQRSLERQVLHSAKMQSLGAFAGGIAHDFNNVMAIVQGHAEALQRMTIDDPTERGRRLDAIQGAVDRASSLVRDLMTLSRPVSESRAPVDIGAIMRATAEALPRLLGEDIRLTLDFDPGPLVVRVDEGRFEAALLNLAANARDAMPVGGSLMIRAKRLDSGAGNASVVIDVIDSGVGMDAPTLHSMFEPFFTTKAPGVGTGLGLATTYTTISESAGTITAESGPGKGTAIHIVLPLEPIPAPTAALSPLTVAAQPTTSATVLVVEDEAELLELTCDVLRSSGYRAYAALDATEALEVLEQHDDIALLLTDVVMPGMGGPELAAIVRRRWPTIGVLFVSGYPATTAQTERIDPNLLLVKPVSDERLLAAVAATVRRA